MNKTELLITILFQLNSKMAFKLAKLRDELFDLKDEKQKDVYYWQPISNHSIARYLSQYEYRIMIKENEIAMFLEVVDVAGRICIQNNLPGGDPCWMSEKIMSYL